MGRLNLQKKDIILYALLILTLLMLYLDFQSMQTAIGMCRNVTFIGNYSYVVPKIG